ASLTPGFDYRIAAGSAGLRHNFTPLLQAEGSGGVSEVRTELPRSGATFYNTYATATLATRYRFPTREQVELRLISQLAPAINRISSFLTQQLQGTFGAVVRTRTWAVDTEGGFAQTIRAGGELASFTFILAQAKFAYRASRNVDLEAGLLG